MISRSLSRSPRSIRRRWGLLAATLPALLACSSSASNKPVTSFSFETKFAANAGNDLDILFMIDDSSGMSAVQEKLVTQLPTFMQALQALPTGLPDVHIAVVSSDMGAPSDLGQSGIGCSQTGGDNGVFFSTHQGTCLDTTLAAGATFISDDADGSTKDFTFADPAGLSTVLQCVSLLGTNGRGFAHQLASIDRALGGDGQPPPSSNAGFLRESAYLAIILLTNQDDCAAPASSSPLPIYSLNGATANDLATPDGPIARYRCNGGMFGGHLCQDLNPGSASTAYAQPPLDPPADATGNPPTLSLSNCESNDTASSGLTPVGQFIADIRALKADPDRQISVSAIAGPTTPYTVQWVPGAGTASNELWPAVEPSCGPTSDGSFANPPVRIAQFVQAFPTGLLTSICDGSYASAMTNIAEGVGGLLVAGSAKCVDHTIQDNALGHPDCEVTNEITNLGVTHDVAIPDCLENGGAAPAGRSRPMRRNARAVAYC